jgi:hypothetical protein
MAKSAQIPLSTWLPGSMEAQWIWVYKSIIFFLSLLISYALCIK